MEKLEHFRLFLLFKSIEGANRNICAVYGDNAIGESTARSFDISDTPRSGRPSGFDDRLTGGGQKHLCRVWGQCHQREHGKKMIFSF